MSGKAGDAIKRQWHMLGLIPQEPRSITAKDLFERLLERYPKVEKRTVERDLKTLAGFLDLYVDKSQKPYLWSWSKDANMRFRARLSPGQGIALLLAQAHLSTLLPAQVQRELTPWFQMAQRELSGGVWRGNYQRTAVVPSVMALQAPVLDDDVLRDVHDALARRRQLTATYRSKGAREGRRSVLHPLGLIVRGQIHYLACTFNGYQDVRQLALHRLSETEVSNTLSAEPEGFDLESYARDSGKYEAEGDVQLVARFAAAAAEHLRETPLSAGQVLRELPDRNAVELSASVTLDQPLRWWLRAFGSQVEVLAPQSLRDEMRADAAASATLYVEQ